MTKQANPSNKNSATPKSTFHKGEQKLQTLTGVRDQMERFGKQVIRDYMPAQHREFYEQLPFVLVGHADNRGWPWASMLVNKPGFISSANEKQLQIQAAPIKGDPLANMLDGSTQESPVQDTINLGMLGIELHTRRRNRLSGHVTQFSAQHIQLEVDQAFGNCPQYIQTREIEYVDPKRFTAAATADITRFDKQARSLIANCDTFFVSSYVASEPINGRPNPNQGVDVSHRGGKPGFVRVDDELTLTIPDYLGNFHFNTLGNIVENPKVGLLFVDFDNGHLLTLTGTAKVLMESPDTKYFEGAERLWTFTIDHGRWMYNSLPLRWKFTAYSPNTLLTGTWDEAEEARRLETSRNRWLRYKVTNIVDESEVIKSFHLKPESGYLTKFKAGQFLTLRIDVDGNELIRTYTVSTAPSEDEYRISVKRETSTDTTIPNGVVSNYMHDEISINDIIYAKAPAGVFTFDASPERPAVLISAGVGVTPMVSMARHAMIEGLRTRSMRPISIINAARNSHQRAFYTELSELESRSNGYLSCYWVLSEVDDSLQQGVDYHHQGRISKKFLQSILPTHGIAIELHDFYLCGPGGFMQSLYDMLIEIGADDTSIFAESFGPTSLDRHTEPALVVPSANEAIVNFIDTSTDLQFEQAWTQQDGTLLEFAESHGLAPAYGCRNGQCGSCKAKLQSGNVTYQQPPAFVTGDDEVLICCAVPAAVETEEFPKLTIKI